MWRRPGRYSCCDDINRRSLGCQHTIDSATNTETADPRRFSAFPGCYPPVTSTEVQTPSITPMGAQQSVAVQAQTPLQPATQVPQQSTAQPVSGKVIMAASSPPAPAPNPVSMFTQQQILFQQQQQILLAQQHKLSMMAAQPNVASRRPIRLPQSPGGQSLDWVSCSSVYILLISSSRLNNHSN